MLDQSWILPEECISGEELAFAIPQGSVIENILNKSDKTERQKSMTISAFFDCNQEAKYVVTIAKFVSIFLAEAHDLKSLQKLSKKERQYIKNYNFESVLADTNRKPFSKFFSKSTLPMVGLSSSIFSTSCLALFIQNPDNQEEKPIIKVVNFENLIHSILVNVSIPEGIEQLSKFIDTRYKKVPTMVCFENVKNKIVSSHILNLLLEKFDEVFYVAIANDHELEISQETVSTVKMNQKSIKIHSSNSYVTLSTNNLSWQSWQQIFKLYNHHRSIDNLIFKLFDNSKMSKIVFKQNQICISYYGILFNFISLNNLRNETISQIQDAFLLKLILEKNQNSCKDTKPQKKDLNRKLGHYPVKISKGSKACCVCDDSKKKKSRYKCEKCSDTYMRDIAICIQHFKEFHGNMHKYIPKGVRKGAYSNELQSFKESEKQKDGGFKEQKISENEQITINFLETIQKWNKRSQNIDKQLQAFANIYHREKPTTSNGSLQNYFQYYNQPPFGVYYPPPQYPMPELFEVKEEANDPNTGVKKQQNN